MILCAYVLIAYCLGSIPFGLILTKMFGYGDLRKIGSGNIGATNALRTGNKKLAACTLLLDGLKGYVALLLITYLSRNIGCHALWADNDGLLFPEVTYICGISAILGHVFPVWLKFKGGKGVATALGTFFILSPYIAIAFILLWISIFKLSRISSLSALSAFLLISCISAVLYFAGIETAITQHYIYLLIVTILIFATHRSNIGRLLKGTEPKSVSKGSKNHEPS